MVLSYDQLKQLTVGALEITKQGDGYHFDRLTQNQKTTYKGIAERYYVRANATAGCRITFHTNSKTMILEVGAAGNYEVLLDGMQAYYFQAPDERRYSVDLSGEDTYVTVVLPALSCGVIKSIVLDEGSYVRPHSFDRKILFLGDSITQGYSAERDTLSYASILTQYFNAEALNCAVAGTCFWPDPLEKVDFDPDVVIVAYGSNDYTHFASMEHLRQSCSEYLKKVKAFYGDKQVFCISPIWRADGKVVRRAGTHQECRACEIEQILENGFIHIDGYTLHPHMPDYFEDGSLHPNALGFSIYARNLIRAMEPHLRK